MGWLTVRLTDLVPLQRGLAGARRLRRRGVEEVEVAVEGDAGEGGGVEPEEAVLHVPELRVVEGERGLQHAGGEVPHLRGWVVKGG